jgi:hypothetical protein
MLAAAVKRLWRGVVNEFALAVREEVVLCEPYRNVGQARAENELDPSSSLWWPYSATAEKSFSVFTLIRPSKTVSPLGAFLLEGRGSVFERLH